MKRFLTVGLLFFAITLQAQDMKTLFVALPDTLSPLLTKVNRQDFGDFLSCNMKAEVQNRFGKNSEMLKLTDDYLLLKMTSVSQVEMKLLPVNDSTQVICVSKTYNGPVSDTEISFYTTDWKRLPTSDFISLPAADDFYLLPESQAGKDSLNSLKMQADLFLLKANLAEKDQSIQLLYTTPNYLDEVTAKTLSSHLRKEPLRYHWKGGRFVCE